MEWINIKDSSPESGELVLVSDGIQICMAFIKSSTNKFTHANTWYDLFHDRVTHWMPLPEPPKKDLNHDGRS